LPLFQIFTSNPSAYDFAYAAFANIFLYEKFLVSAQKAVVHLTLGPI